MPYLGQWRLSLHLYGKLVLPRGADTSHGLATRYARRGYLRYARRDGTKLLRDRAAAAARWTGARRGDRCSYRDERLGVRATLNCPVRRAEGHHQRLARMQSDGLSVLMVSGLYAARRRSLPWQRTARQAHADDAACRDSRNTQPESSCGCSALHRSTLSSQSLCPPR